MRKGLILIPIVLLALAGCGGGEEELFSARYTIRPEPEPTQVYFDVTYTDETQVIRSDAMDADAVCALFSQALFGTQDGAAVRWVSPVRYAAVGAYTAEDTQAVADFVSALSHVSGFPAVQAVSMRDANLLIRFENTDQVQFKHSTDAHGRILSADITIPSDWDAAQRSAAVNRYGMRACGFFYSVRTPLDSVLSDSVPAASLTDADYMLLEGLYGSIEPGEEKAVCLQKFSESLQ